jgi:flagellar basal body rod protein FlgC
MNELDLLDRAAGGMALQRDLLDLAARNVAAAQASTPGHTYARLVASFAPDDDDDADDAAPPRMTGVRREAGTGDPLTELIGALDAQRAFESDASLFDVGKRIVERTLDVERS